MATIEIYREKAGRYAQLSQQYQSCYERNGVTRLLVFGGFAAAVFLLAQFGWPYALAGAVLFIALFYRLVKWHLRLLDQSRDMALLAKINEDEISRINLDLAKFDSGERFGDEKHPYCDDLDFFGEKSIFSLLNRGNTELGKEKLADYFKSSPQPYVEVLSRQEALIELCEKLDWMQQFMLAGMKTEDDPKHHKLLIHWAQQENELPSYMRWVLILMPFYCLISVAVASYFFSFAVFLVMYIPVAWLWKKSNPAVDKLHQNTAKAGDVLSLYADLIQLVEKESFTSNKIKFLKDKLTTGNIPASKSLRRLSYLISQLDVRFNPFSLLLNMACLWDLQWAYRLETWKSKHAQTLPDFFVVMAEMEVMVSLAMVKRNFPDTIFPEVSILPQHEEAEVALASHHPYQPANLVFKSSSSKPQFILAEEAGHLMIDENKRVVNDFSIAQKSRVVLITGSNMGGKSTFLRTLGINLVLAGIGSPVFAKRLDTPLLHVFTSMRTKDALRESASSFYAELLRLKSLIEAVERGKDVFFLLDEVLKGTNSRDQHIGMRALLLQLSQAGATGLAATHDLAIGELTQEFPNIFESACFEVETKGDELFFDYKYKPGVSQSFNATQLMKRIGIKI